MNKILKQLTAIFVASIISTTAIATHEDVVDYGGNIGTTATNTNVDYETSNISITNSSLERVDTALVFDHYKTVIKQVPYEVEVCRQVLQGTGDGSATNEIVGAIIGGAIGNQFGEGDGKDAMTLAGIFLGASLAHDDEPVQGPGAIITKCNIETRYEEVVQKVYSHSTIKFEINNRHYSLKFVK